MTSITVLRNLTSIALTACCVIGVSSARAQTYSLIDLGSLPSGTSATTGVNTPAAINNQAEAQVAGTSGTFAFRYTVAAIPPMENAARNSPQSISRGFGINESGLVVGDSTFGKGQASRAAVFSNGTATDLGTLQNSGPFSRGTGINASGQVVGFSGDKLDGDSSRAFLVRIFSGPTRMLDLGTLGGLYAQAMAINDSGFVTGNSQTAAPGFGEPSTRAFIWDINTQMRDLGTLGGTSSYGTSINAKNHVVGYSTINRVDNRIHAFLSDGAQMTDLGSLGGASVTSDRSFALSVNATDQVVGYSYLPSSVPAPGLATQVAFIFQQGLMVDLNELIGPASSNYRLYSATAINDQGQIVAVAFAHATKTLHAVLLTPTPVGIQQ